MPVEYIKGNGPIILAMPYTGTNMQRTIAQRLIDESHCFTVPDRYLDRLLIGVDDTLGIVRANFHRYVSDVDCLYPQKSLTTVPGMHGIIPLSDSNGDPIWQMPPTAKEVSTWRILYYAPYHAALAAEIARIRAKYGYAILLNCQAARVKAGQEAQEKPLDIEIATTMGASCSISLSSKLAELFKSSGEYSTRLSGHTSTGWTSRHYGHPENSVHAIDLKFNENCYVTSDDDTLLYDVEKSQGLRSLISDAIRLLHRWSP